MRELRRLDRQVIPRIVSVVDDLCTDPFPSGVRRLQGVENMYRVRVGDYRVIYEVIKTELVVHIVRVRHRKDVYERL